MNKHLESIYKNSPICFQDIFCSLYGFKLYRERYGPAWRLYFNHLIKTQFANEEEINLMQVISLKKILRHAIKHVPYYRDTIKLKNEVIERISSMENIREIPVLDKSTLRNNPEEFLSNYYSKNKLVKVHTSGTTGTPLTIYIDPNARKRNYAFLNDQKGGLELTDLKKVLRLLVGRLCL